ncbi:tRNA lysidine(34) synthetase TilS [Acidocella sp.]|uniref:tRNA lysidine(34) synthetase TilS n=1 Tax=Acidocella sp. TaxID=50710 RepID=UPI002F3E58B4
MTTLPEAFAAAMARLGPFTAVPRLSVAVSGGADSSALALLAQGWAAERGGDVLALIVDHGLRQDSAAEAALTASRLQGSGIASRVLTLADLHGAGLQERARAARYEILAAAARDAGRPHLLLGHHEADQAETVAMRAARGAGGAEGMPAWSARRDVVLVRPLLRVEPGELRVYLRARGIGWVEDPSNLLRRFERVRWRQAGVAPAATEAAAMARRVVEMEAAAFLARVATFHGEGFVRLDAPSAPASALAALLRSVGGADYKPRQGAVAALAQKLRPATLGGVRVVPAGRLGSGWLLCREPAACAPPIEARASVIWDQRFRLDAEPPPGSHFGALGADAAQFRKFNGLPTLVLRTMPCLRGPGDGAPLFPVQARFSPPAPVTSLPFFS